MKPEGGLEKVVDLQLRLPQTIFHFLSTANESSYGLLAEGERVVLENDELWTSE